jgi:hypothetical protein
MAKSQNWGKETASKVEDKVLSRIESKDAAKKERKELKSQHKPGTIRAWRREN